MSTEKKTGGKIIRLAQMLRILLLISEMQELQDGGNGE